jgi:class 3 adenylate cyclase
MYVAAGNISGNEINLVLQLVKKADVGQVIATSALVEALSDDLKSHTSNIGVVRLESINEDVDIYNVSLDITSDTDRELAIKTVVIPPPVKKKKKQKVQPVGKKKIL